MGAIVARAAVFLSTIGIVGAVAFRYFVVRRALVADGGVSAAGALARRTGQVAASALCLAVPLRVAVQAQTFAGDAGWLGMVPRVLSTTWGHAAVWQFAAALMALAGLLVAAQGNPRGWYHATVSALVLVIAPAFMGHAGAAEHYTAISITTDIAHVTAVSAWMGGLFILTAFAMRAGRSAEGGATTAALVDRFHHVAMWSVGTAIVTGTIAAWMHLNHFSDFVREPYGELLFRKLVFVGIAVGLGWWHSRTAAKKARAGGGAAIAKSLAFEWVVLLVVIAFTALLTGSEPPSAS